MLNKSTLIVGSLSLIAGISFGTIASAETSLQQSQTTKKLTTITPEAPMKMVTTVSNSGSNAPNVTPPGTSPNPYGCYGASQSPHASSHVPGNVTAQVISRCAVAVPTLTAYGDLERALGLGFTSGVATAYQPGYGTYVHANPGAPFPVQTSLYVIYGTSTAVGDEGENMAAYTSNQATVTDPNWP